MFIETNPKDKIYRDLIDLAFEICEEFILVVRHDISEITIFTIFCGN